MFTPTPTLLATCEARAATLAHHRCRQQVQIAAASPESKGWTFPTLEGEQKEENGDLLEENVPGNVQTDSTH